MNPQTEPVIFGAIARIVVLVAAKYGLALDATQLVALIVAVEAVAAPIVRRVVHPDVKVQAKIQAAYARGAADSVRP